MPALLGLIAGYASGLLITLIPGMLNMQVVSTSLRLGRRGAYVFSAGLVVVIVFQAVLAVLFADYLTRHPAILAVIKQWTIAILVFLAIGFTIKGYYVRKRRSEPGERPYKGGPFWRGLMMSFMNIFNIPLIFAIAGYLLAQNILAQDYLSRLLYVVGIALGAATSFYGYARLADWISRHAAYVTRNIYFFLGGLLFALALVQGFRIY